MSVNWKYKLKELFTFSKKERVGFIVLILIVISILLYPLLDFGGKVNEGQCFEEFTKQVDETEALQAKENKQVDSLFYFDPNTADSLTFLKLGFSSRQVKSILSYRNTGAWFSQPDDFSKLYVVSEEQFQRLKPYIDIKQTGKPFKKVELNTADTTELKRLRGIGSYYAAQIVRYREYLGGFYSAEQLKEIKGIEDERFALFANQYTLNSSLLKPINVNMSDESRLKSHPYIGSQLAREIVSFRQTVFISSLEQLVNANILKPDKAEKLQYYLVFE